MGDEPCFRRLGLISFFQVRARERAYGLMQRADLTFIGTHPRHERRGAGSMLVKWGMEQARLARVPLELESTKEGIKFYRELGFVAGETITMDIPDPETGGIVLYEEVVFVFWP